MLIFLILLEVGLLIGGVYKALDDKRSRAAKLERVQRKNAEHEARKASPPENALLNDPLPD